MKIVLAYSGGLDTSVALRWLIDRYDAEVYAYCADIGQQESLDGIERKAKETGAVGVLVEDLRETFLTDYVWPALLANAAYDRQYLLAAPMSRPLICARMISYARSVGADAIAHGATGKGNDQVRFAGGAAALAPDLTLLTPLLEWDLTSRQDEIRYAADHGIPVDAVADKPYSVDTNIWGSSIECGVLDDIAAPPPEEIYLMTRDPDRTGVGSQEITVGFTAGVPTSVDGERMSPVALVERLNAVAGRHGVGRIDLLENRVVGFKTRGVYESPAGTVLHRAHRELESVVLDRDTLHTAETLGQRYGQLIYDGLWFSPLRTALDGFFAAAQEPVTGSVTLRLGHGRIDVVRRSTPNSLYDRHFASYESDDQFEHLAGAGFSYAFTMPMRIRGLARRRDQDTVGS
ncbi:argininosuccinate synthase [Actinophytocola xinjiangensis]|uniref:Argininosuccinate synthase n=1 Tax=Actinophytocola xinjiangensis TaxID=485602 RepID=A0A7Z0WRZ3_9PSEU|nr:argininosuccinate synthase [Actinophytocola xinjiangensis]OLF14253.1 argininosuccinate synthase [Actinophytocola xinjiangensis]